MVIIKKLSILFILATTISQASAQSFVLPPFDACLSDANQGRTKCDRSCIYSDKRRDLNFCLAACASIHYDEIVKCCDSPGPHSDRGAEFCEIKRCEAPIYFEYMICLLDNPSSYCKAMQNELTKDCWSTAPVKSEPSKLSAAPLQADQYEMTLSKD